MLRRGSHFVQQLRVVATGNRDNWIELTAYGHGPRPVVESPYEGPCEEINYTGSLDEAAVCIYVEEAGYFKASHITVYNSYYGLLVNNYRANHSNVVIEDVLAVDIQNFGQQAPRVNSSGIEVVVGRGHECSDIVLSDVTIRDCECYRTGTGVSVRAYGEGGAVKDVRLKKMTSHDHANTPWSYVGLFLNGVVNADCNGICLDRCAPHWKHTGTATVHYVRSDFVKFRNSYIGHTQDTDSHDMGGWDFEGGGHDCIIENCTFDSNAGPAIEYLRCENTAQQVEVRNCTFLNNDWTLWGGAKVLHVGRSGPDPTGSVRDNAYVLAAGTEFGGEPFFTMRDNREYEDPADLPPCVRPPVVNAGADRTLTDLKTQLSADVSNATRWRWETVLAPGEVVFEDEENLETEVRFSERGTYILRLFAENEHLVYGDYVTIRCVEDEKQEILMKWDEGDQRPGEIELTRTFTLTCRFRQNGPGCEKQLLISRASGYDPIDGFRLCLDGRAQKERTILFETGDGEDRDTACSRKGVLLANDNAWHQLTVSCNCSSRDGRGEARIIFDGEDVTLFAGAQSSMGREGYLRIAEPSAGKNKQKKLRDEITGGMEGPAAQLSVPPEFQLAFEDDFAGGLRDNWRILSGDWRVEGGRLIVEGKGEILCTQKFPGDVLLVYEAGTDNSEPGDLSATLNALPESGTMHGYFFGFGTEGNEGGKLLRRTGPIAEYDARICPGKRHRIACMRAGKHFTHIVDGEEVFSYEDPRPLSSGRQPYIALYSHAGGWFENVWVYRCLPVRPGPFTGDIADVRIYNRLLGPDEIRRKNM